MTSKPLFRLSQIRSCAAPVNVTMHHEGAGWREVVAANGESRVSKEQIKPRNDRFTMCMRRRHGGPKGQLRRWNDGCGPSWEVSTAVSTKNFH
ncbi:hypothetical protein NXT3_PB00006 (plasmid) [Sinorhizobium fredii]|uniref:Uncharacterized protein n=1 Tax=Rhizobium fredii TaxID=380 RepID=A0A2L0HAY7_RHIFR|nr:hypothetical protein NXT3_PB00006 [Sinorhizobium fredii]